MPHLRLISTKFDSWRLSVCLFFVSPFVCSSVLNRVWHYSEIFTRGNVIAPFVPVNVVNILFTVEVQTDSVTYLFSTSVRNRVCPPSPRWWAASAGVLVVSASAAVVMFSALQRHRASRTRTSSFLGRQIRRTCFPRRRPLVMHGIGKKPSTSLCQSLATGNNNLNWHERHSDETIIITQSYPSLLRTCFTSSLEPTSCITQNSSSELFIPLSATSIWTCRFNLLHTAITFHHFITLSLWGQNLPFQKILSSNLVCFRLSDWPHGSIGRLTDLFAHRFLCLSLIYFRFYLLVACQVGQLSGQLFDAQ